MGHDLRPRCQTECSQKPGVHQAKERKQSASQDKYLQVKSTRGRGKKGKGFLFFQSLLMLFLLGQGHGRNNYKVPELSGKHDNDKISQDSTSQQTFVFCYPSISKSNGYWRGSCNRNEGTKSRASLAQIMLCPVSALDLGGPSMPASAPLITWKWSRHFRDIPAASHSSNLLLTGHLLGAAAAISAVTGHGCGRRVIYNGFLKKERSQLCWNMLGCSLSPESGVHTVVQLEATCHPSPPQAPAFNPHPDFYCNPWCSSQSSRNKQMLSSQEDIFNKEYII